MPFSPRDFLNGWLPKLPDEHRLLSFIPTGAPRDTSSVLRVADEMGLQVWEQQQQEQRQTRDGTGVFFDSIQVSDPPEDSPSAPGQVRDLTGDSFDFPGLFFS